jgi:hypothetical protein
MRIPRTARALVAAACALAGALAVPRAAVADDTVPGVTSSISWREGVVNVQASLRLDPSVPSTVRAEAEARATLESRFPALLIEQLSPVLVDSARTIGDLVQADPAFADNLVALAQGTGPDEVHPSPDFTSLVERWQLPLYGTRGIAAPLFPREARPVRRALGVVATRVFSGLLIVAQGKLPAVGGGAAALEPALLPRIWDEDMNLVLEVGNCSSEALRARGMVEYLTSIDEAAITARAGPSPLRVVARKVFGTHPVDIVLTREAALQLLTVPENIQALTEGRIVIVYGGS